MFEKALLLMAFEASKPQKKVEEGARGRNKKEEEDEDYVHVEVDPRQKELQKLSRMLVTLCRAKAEGLLVHRADGCLPADRLIAALQPKFAKRLELNDATLLEVIARQKDARLGYKLDPADGKLWIYCYQGLLNKYMKKFGGTVEHHQLYSRVTLATTKDKHLFHSTFAAFVPSILAEGLKPGGRDVHLWGEENKKRGRGGADCVFMVDVALLLKAGCELWLAGNGVYLVESVIPPECLTLVSFNALY